MSLSPEPALLLWLSAVTWPISAKRRALRKGDKDSDFLSAKSTTGLSRSDANEGNFPHGLFDPLQARAGRPGRGRPRERQESRRGRPGRAPSEGRLPLPAPLPEPTPAWRTSLWTSFFPFFKKSDSNRNYKLQHTQCFIYCSETIYIYFLF